jgi:hypothetical protein
MQNVLSLQDRPVRVPFVNDYDLTPSNEIAALLILVGSWSIGNWSQRPRATWHGSVGDTVGPEGDLIQLSQLDIVSRLLGTGLVTWNESEREIGESVGCCAQSRNGPASGFDISS